MHGALSLRPAARHNVRFAGCFVAGFLLIALAATLGWLRPFDRAIARLAYVDAPCPIRQASNAVSIAFAGELSLLWGGIGAAALTWRRRPLLAALLLGLLFATVAIEVGCKHLLDQPSPGAFVATLARRPCAPPASPGPGGAVQSAHAALPSAAAGRAAYVELSSLPSGYACRAAFFGLIAAAALGARWPRLAGPARWSMLALAAALGSTRVVIAWHWPSDIVAGLLLGWGAGSCFVFLASEFGQRGARGCAAAGTAPG
jgi:membrane-associated phospholipid phosphatase